jgi:predicted TPR repeat methyltransferase
MSSSESFYDDLSQSYSSVSKDRTNYLVSIEKIISSKLSHLKKERLLDFGSGDGLRIQKIVSGFEIEITAVENSSQMCNLLRTNSAIAHVCESDIVRFDVEPAAYNYVTALWNVFGHIKEIDIAINKAYESLVDGGIFIFDVNNPLNIGEYGIYSVTKNFFSFIHGLTEKKFKLVKGGSETWVHFRPHWYYQKILKSAGFNDLSRLYLNYETGKKTTFFNGQILIICMK